MQSSVRKKEMPDEKTDDFQMDDEHFMRAAMALARKAAKLDEVPIAATRTEVPSHMLR